MAAMPVPAWEADYQHDRRNHRHRCRRCNRIINAGERVLMTRLKHNKTLAVHSACADMVHGMSIDGWTYRDALTAWGTDYLRSIGYRIEAHPMSLSGARAEGRAA